MQKGDDQEPTQQTTPQGATIPVPTREAFLRDMAKVAPTVEREPSDEQARDAREEDR